jgi:DME family drug/metabolite transporter
VGGLVLAAVAVVVRGDVRGWLCGREWPWLVVAMLSTGIFQAVFFAAVNRTGAALATLVALGAAPIATGLLARVTHREPLTLVWGVATGMAIAGCALLVLPGGAASMDAIGVGLALVAATCYGGYTVAAKRLLERERPLEGVIAASALGGALVLAPALAVDAGGLLTFRGVSLAAWLGLASTATAYMLFFHGLRRVPASLAGTLGLAEPLVALLLGVLVLGERLTGTALAGGVLLLLGIALAGGAATGRRSRRRPTPAPVGDAATVTSPGG